MVSAREILAHVKISAVYQALTGTGPRRTGSTDTFRGPAVWRGGDSYSSVSLDDQRGTWHDWVTDESGGVLGLVQRVHGGSSQDALRWVAALAGLSLDDRPLSAKERQRRARQSQQISRHLAPARQWRRTMVALTEELLEKLKLQLFARSSEIRPLEIFSFTQLLARLRRLDGDELIGEFLRWRRNEAKLTRGMVAAGEKFEGLERRALHKYIAAQEAE